MAKKKKKYVASIANKKTAALMLKKQLKNKLLVYVTGSQSSNCDIYTRTGKLFKVSRTTAIALDTLRFKWHVTLWVACKPLTGDKYISQSICNTGVEYTRNQLSVITGKAFDELKASQNRNHVVSYGWVASIEGTDLTDAELNNLITQHNGWEGLYND